MNKNIRKVVESYFTSKIEELIDDMIDDDTTLDRILDMVSDEDYQEVVDMEFNLCNEIPQADVDAMVKTLTDSFMHKFSGDDVETTCYKIFEKSGYGGVIDFVNEQIDNKNPDYKDVSYGFCQECNNDMPALNNTCLICGEIITLKL